MKTRCTILLVLLVLLAGVPAVAKNVSFKKIILDKTFRAEGVAVEGGGGDQLGSGVVFQ